MRRYWFLTTSLLFLSSASGCIVPYAYPKLDYTPQVKLDTPPGEVHAFRVDVMLQGYPNTNWPFCIARLTEISDTSMAEVPAQIKLSLTSGNDLFGLNFDKIPVGTDHAVALRLYRPGYDLVEIASWDKVDRVVWQPAPDLKTQERALDLLTSANAAYYSSAALENQALWVHSGGWGLENLPMENGSASTEHRAALLFAAKEYERLAAAATSPDEKNGLKTKASYLRECAAK